MNPQRLMNAYRLMMENQPPIYDPQMPDTGEMPNHRFMFNFDPMKKQWRFRERSYLQQL